MNQPTTNPTYDEKLQKLRDAGVIDMELNTFQNFEYDWNNYIYIQLWSNWEVEVNWENIKIITKEDVNNIINTWVNMQWRFIDMKELIKSKVKILWHDLTYWRACWWIIENKMRDWNYCFEDIIMELLNRWNNPDKPLSQQENKEELVDFIYNLVQDEQPTREI